MSEAQHELKIDLILDAPREKLFRCWTDAQLIKQWFAPKPWTISHAEMDVRPGGASLVVMRSPEGQEFPNPGLFLEIVPNEKIVMTDALSAAYRPAGKPFMVAEVLFEDAGGGKTRYIARAMHWNDETLQEHKQMGFHEGWTAVARQLEELAKTL